jgi:hypothetical protein
MCNVSSREDAKEESGLDVDVGWRRSLGGIYVIDKETPVNTFFLISPVRNIHRKEQSYLHHGSNSMRWPLSEAELEVVAEEEAEVGGRAEDPAADLKVRGSMMNPSMASQS